jgi:tRNA-Thr(GGU) m(6)t(6)A37 methyltransferase TsaA
MSLEVNPIAMRPIGWVRSPITAAKDDCWAGTVVSIELDPSQFGPESLQGLDAFSHADILYHFDRIATDRIHTGLRHPRGRTDWPAIGIFAQRGRERPNRIGVSTVRIERVEGTRLFVAELDAIDGTPVLDIKPYMEEFGPRTAVRQPEWSRELMKSYFL